MMKSSNNQHNTLDKAESLWYQRHRHVNSGLKDQFISHTDSHRTVDQLAARLIKHFGYKGALLYCHHNKWLAVSRAVKTLHNKPYRH